MRTRKRKNPRQRLDGQISMKIALLQLLAIQKIASNEGVSISVVIREAIKLYLSQEHIAQMLEQEGIIPQRNTFIPK